MNFTMTMRVSCGFYVIEVLWYLLEMSAMLWNNFIPMQFCCRLARRSATVPSNRPYSRLIFNLTIIGASHSVSSVLT